MIYPQNFINQIILGNCINIMKYIPNDSIDLTITSPPYDNLRTYENRLNEFRFEPIAQELYRITKIGCSKILSYSCKTYNAMGKR